MTEERFNFVEALHLQGVLRPALTVDFYDGAMSGILVDTQMLSELGFMVVGFAKEAGGGADRVARAWPLAPGTSERLRGLIGTLPFGAARTAIAGHADPSVRGGRAWFPERSKHVVEFGGLGEVLRVWKANRPVTDAEVVASFELRSAQPLWEFMDPE